MAARYPTSSISRGSNPLTDQNQWDRLLVSSPLSLSWQVKADMQEDTERVFDNLSTYSISVSIEFLP